VLHASHTVAGMVQDTYRCRSDADSVLRTVCVVGACHNVLCLDEMAYADDSSGKIGCCANKRGQSANTCRIFHRQGQPHTVSVFRNLLKAALSDRRNAKFVFVSDDSIPIRHPALFWAQSIAESHLSRVDATVVSDLGFAGLLDLMNEDMARHGMQRPGTQPEVYRGDPWVSLSRMHAEIVSGDEHVWPFFKKFCRSSVRGQMSGLQHDACLAWLIQNVLKSGCICSSAHFRSGVTMHVAL
jgi:hypothetical protein